MNNKNHIIIFMIFLLILSFNSNKMDWVISEKEYKSETIELSEPDNIIVISRIENKKNQKIYPKIDLYLRKFVAMGLGVMLLPTDNLVKKILKNICSYI